MNRRKISFNIVVSMIAIIFSLIISGVFIMILGDNPLLVYSSMLDGAFGDLNALSNTLSKAIPLMLCGLSFSFAAKGGVFNIGSEGQLYIGAIAATFTALLMDGYPRGIVIISSFIAAFLVAGLLGILLGVAKAKLNLNEVIVAIMLNYIVMLFCSWLVNGPMKPEDSMVAQTEMFRNDYMLKKLLDKTQLTSAFIIGILLCFLLYIFFKKTRLGYNINVLGKNKNAAHASGINIGRTIIITMLISGGLSGIAGATEVFGKYGRFIDGFSPGFGFTGIAVSVLAANNPIGIIFTSILFGAMDAGAMKMSYAAGISSNMVKVIQGLSIMFIATPNIAKHIISKIKQAKNKESIDG